jgi:hypothetical protein
VVVLSGLCTAAALGLATIVLASRGPVVFTVLATLAVALSTFNCAAAGGLMATLVRAEERGRAGGGSLLTAVGCLAGGAIADRMDRWRAYLGSGLVIGIIAVLIAGAPRVAPAFLAGATSYLLLSGVVNAAYTAFLLEIIGRRSRSASAQYTFLNNLGNLPVAYMTWLDGQGHKFLGGSGTFCGGWHRERSADCAAFFPRGAHRGREDGRSGRINGSESLSHAKPASISRFVFQMTITTCPLLCPASTYR